MARWGGGVRELQGVVDAGSSLGRWGRRALPVPRRDEALPAARHEALALVFSNPQAQGCRLFIFIGVRLTFSLYFFFNQRTNISAKSLFLFKFFFSFFFFLSFFPLVLFPHPADFSADPALLAAVFPPGCPGLGAGRSRTLERPRGPDPSPPGAAPRARCPSPNLHKSAVALHHPSSLKGA